MLRFLQFLKEGGNLPFTDPTKPEQGSRVSDSIDSGRRDEESGHFKDMFNSIDNGFKKQHGHNLFGNALKNNTHASGSAEAYNNPNISTERFKKAKASMGDYDVQVPEEHKEKLKQYIQPGQKHGKFHVVHVDGTGSQVHAVVRHEDTGKHHQIDFEPVEYDKETQEPTQFEKFAHNSHIDDLEKGLKGVHHKYLLQSILAAHSKPAIISKMTGRGKARTEVQDEGSYTPHTFSVDKGMREKWKTVGEKDGKPIVQEQPSKGAEYTKHLPTIYRNLFRRDPSDQDIQDMHHFGGLVDHIKKHIPPEHHGKIFDTFVNKLWHPSAQETSIDPVADKKLKDTAYGELAKHFPKEAAQRQQITDQQKAEYYDPNGKRFKRGAKIIPSTEPKNPDNIAESKDEDFHVAVAAGRFTGPTKEHEKLLNNLFSQKAHAHHVFVMGPETKDKTTEKDPLTVDEKIDHLKKLYPDKADSFIPGTHRHTKNPAKAVTWAWHQHQKPGRKVHLTVVAGSGDEGVAKKSAAGGSLENYKQIVDKYNKTRFPRTENPDGTVRGGDLRMDYESTKFVENPRGKTSGSVMRKFAKTNDHNNPEHVEQFKDLLHSKFSHEDAKGLMKKIKERSSGIKESLLQSITRILNNE
jgi:hypothetical protein